MLGGRPLALRADGVLRPIARHGRHADPSGPGILAAAVAPDGSVVMTGVAGHRRVEPRILEPL